jgi:hypothetical protein
VQFKSDPEQVSEVFSNNKVGRVVPVENSLGGPSTTNQVQFPIQVCGTKGVVVGITVVVTGNGVVVTGITVVVVPEGTTVVVVVTGGKVVVGAAVVVGVGVGPTVVAA